ncbi:MAG: OmpA family protein [Phycisphaerales bacterium]
MRSLTVVSATRSTRIAVAIGAAVIGMTLGGCKGKGADLEAQLEQFQVENSDLRTENQRLEAALAECDLSNDAIATENSRIQSENDRLRQEIAALQNRPAANSGFEGIAGVGVSSRAGELVVEVAGDVLFDSGKVTLKNDSKQRLNDIARVIQQRYPGNTIRIAGHTDNDPIRKSSWKTNERLSAERALAVQEYLASRGVDKSRTYAAAYGPSMPKGSKSQSRRVEIIILAPGGS